VLCWACRRRLYDAGVCVALTCIEFNFGTYHHRYFNEILAILRVFCFQLFVLRICVCVKCGVRNVACVYTLCIIS
jgi:hypothetical protein